MAIQTTPRSTAETAARKPKNKKSMWTPKPKVLDAYNAAKAQGKDAEELFLHTHPKFARKMGLSTTSPTGKTVPDSVSVPAASKEAKPVLKTTNQFAADDIRNQQQAINAQTTDFAGSTSGVTYDAEGKPHFTTKLGDQQQKIFDTGQALTQTGQAKAQDILGGYQQFAMGDDQRSKLEDAVYARLTKNVDRDFNIEKDQLEQTLYNRGIPLDPTNPQYKQNMDALNEKYAAIKENASNQAVQQGAAEYQSEYQRQLSTHQQGLADASTLQKQGTGFVAPQTPGFETGKWDTTTPTTVEMGIKDIAAQKAIAALQAKTALQQSQIAADAAKSVAETNNSEEDAPPIG